MYIHLGGLMDILDLQPPTIEWRVYRNDAAPMTILLADSDDNALDLTDWDFEGKVREYPLDNTVVTTISIVKNENVLTLELDTADLPLISFFDIQGTNTDNGKINTVLRGQIFIEEDITR
jgi:hypothetical protein